MSRKRGSIVVLGRLLMAYSAVTRGRENMRLDDDTIIDVDDGGKMRFVWRCGRRWRKGGRPACGVHARARAHGGEVLAREYDTRYEDKRERPRDRGFREASKESVTAGGRGTWLIRLTAAGARRDGQLGGDSGDAGG